MTDLPPNPPDTPPSQPAASRWAGRLPLIVLIAITLLGAIPRLAGLANVPPALHPDEAATAADAAAFFQTPALTYAHERGGWVEGTYVATAAAPLALARATGWFSLETAARLPAALAGCLLILAVAWAGRELTRSWQVALGAAICLALQPWAWHFSHLALRGTLTPLLICVGLAAWLRSERAEHPRRWGVLAGLSLALAAATYPPIRLQVPILVAILWASRPKPDPERPQRRQARRWALGITLGTVLLLLPWTLSGQGSERLGAVLAWEVEAGLIQNLGAVLKGYFRHFGTRFMFSGSSSRGFAPEGVGLLPRWQGVLLVLGILGCLLRHRRSDGLILALVLIFPLAAAPTRDVPNAMRAVLGIAALALLAGRGWQVLRAVVVAGHQESRRAGLLMASVVLALAIAAGWATSRKAYLYFVRYPEREAEFYYPGRRELIERAALLAAKGQATRCELPFLEASLRLYAPTLPAKRTGDRWTLGPGEPTRALSLDGTRVRERRLR
ncbi:MAG: phospholipid carrier-dependent glycosyltransferase [Planctomycetes bacterium]|nr:phospholipid carrier-dependent glycosyltransferase [Planctomycetota bacterium]